MFPHSIVFHFFFLGGKGGEERESIPGAEADGNKWLRTEAMFVMATRCYNIWAIKANGVFHGLLLKAMKGALLLPRLIRLVFDRDETPAQHSTPDD